MDKLRNFNYVNFMSMCEMGSFCMLFDLSGSFWEERLVWHNMMVIL